MSQYSLGVLHELGEGVPQSDAQAQSLGPCVYTQVGRLNIYVYVYPYFEFHGILVIVRSYKN